MNILERLHERIINPAGRMGHENNSRTNELISFGVLLRIVADADDKFLDVEEKEITFILKKYGRIPDEDLPVIIKAVEVSAQERIDIHAFTREMREAVQRKNRARIIENLFRIACVDNDLDNNELEMIRKIAELLGLDHGEFIEAKVKIKKEFSMDTGGL